MCSRLEKSRGASIYRRGVEKEPQMNFSRASEHTSALDSAESGAYLLQQTRGVAFRSRKDVKSPSKVTMPSRSVTLKRDVDKLSFEQWDERFADSHEIFSANIVHSNSCFYRGNYTETTVEEEAMIADNCFSAATYLLCFAQRPPQRYALRRLYLLLKRIPYKTRAKFNFFFSRTKIHSIRFSNPSLSFVLFRSLFLPSFFPAMCVRRD